MKAEEKEHKERIKFRFAAGLFKALKNSKTSSYRMLAKNAGMEPAHMQRISVGKLDVTLTTNVALANALGISFSELALFYDDVNEKDLEEFQKYLDKQKKTKGNHKQNLTTKSKSPKKGTSKKR